MSEDVGGANMSSFLKRGRRRNLLKPWGALAIALLVVGAFVAVGLTVLPSNTATTVLAASQGDPNGRIMSQLVSIAAVLPGYGTSRLPEMESVPWPLQNYLVRIEPAWDSCDGMAGTFGWDNVIVQAGFEWKGTPAQLFELLNQRLLRVGWESSHLVAGARNPLYDYAVWSGPLPSGIRASIDVNPQQDDAHQFLFVASAPPVGRRVKVC